MTTFYRISDRGDLFGFFADKVSAFVFIAQHATLFSDQAQIVPVSRKIVH